MLVGKTYPSTSQDDVLSKYNEVQILTSVFPEITQLPYKMCSPFRTDNNPSFSIFLDDDNHVRYKDFGKPDEKGGLIKLLCRFWNCTIQQALDKVCSLGDRCASASDGIQRINYIKALKKSEVSHLSDIQVKVREWRDYDYEYWASYGITEKWLKYAEVYPISHKIVTKRDSETGEAKTYVFPAPKYCYCYCERKEGNLSLKIYSPFSDTYKWCSKMDASVVSLWTKVPEYGDKLIIASSVKDALTISNNLKIPAIAPQGEGYNLSQTAIMELKRRYKNVYISFDGDSAGIKDALKLSEETGFNIVPCPILDTPAQDREQVKKLIKEGLNKKDKAKDWSDIFLYFGKTKLIKEFNKALSYADRRDLERRS